jgi:hypothetical protein
VWAISMYKARDTWQMLSGCSALGAGSGAKRPHSISTFPLCALPHSIWQNPWSRPSDSLPLLNRGRVGGKVQYRVGFMAPARAVQFDAAIILFDYLKSIIKVSIL